MKCAFWLGMSFFLAACGASDAPETPAVEDVAVSPDTTVADAEDVALPATKGFLFGVDKAQTISVAPFPNNLYLDTDGVHLAPLATDPIVSALAKADVLAMWDQAIQGRGGFGSTSAIWFFVDEAPDIASFAGMAELRALDGPEAGAVLPADAFWSASAKAVCVFPKFGHWLMSGSTYAALIKKGVKTAGGADYAVPEGFPATLAGYVELNPDDYVVGTVFTTEEVMPFGKALIQAAESFTLEPPTRRVRYDAGAKAFVSAELREGVALDALFGVPEAPFDHNPGRWGGSRKQTVHLPGYEKEYTGGTGHFGIGKVVSGSIVVPAFNLREDAVKGVAPQAFDLASGAPKATVKALAPFTLYLCAGQPEANVPVAIFNHGGGALRTDALPMANANCKVGIATIAIDMVFHGGRRETAWLADDKLVVPIVADLENDFTGAKEGDAGFVPDDSGDGGSSAASVAPLFAAESGAHPLFIEANALTVTTDTYTLARYLREGDWSQVLPGLSFDKERLYHESLSFGTSYTTPLMALTDVFRGIVTSVGSGEMLSINMPMACANALQASALLVAILGLDVEPADLRLGSYQNLPLSLHQWLHERGDPMVWAPYVLRHRQFDKPFSVLGSGDSWDETLFGPTQVTFANAYGLVPYTAGAEWTIDATMPGSETVKGVETPEGGLSGNVTYGKNTYTAGLYYFGKACHAELLSAICTSHYEHPYPPVAPLGTPVSYASPICAIHGQIVDFLTSLQGGASLGHIAAPTATCESLY